MYRFELTIENSQATSAKNVRFPYCPFRGRGAYLCESAMVVFILTFPLLTRKQMPECQENECFPKKENLIKN